MRSLDAMLFAICAIATAFTAAPAMADVTVTETFHVDAGWEAGGYWELAVHNTSGADVYMVTVGNNGADLIVVRSPDLVGVWAPVRISTGEWDAGDINFHGAEWEAPDPTTLPSATYFPGSSQILVYYLTGPNPPLANGATLTGLYFNYPISAAATSTSSLLAGSPFVVFGADGGVVAQGETVSPPVATEQTTWGKVKALYR